jgi:hypothetical protein
LIGTLVALLTLASLAPAPAAAANAVANPSFESSLSGWIGWQATLKRVSVTGAPSGSWVAKATRTTSPSTRYSIGTSATIATTTAGAPCTATAWVKSGATSAVGKQVNLVIREWKSGAIVRSTNSADATLGTGWKQLTTTITPTASGNGVDIYVLQSGAASGDALLTDMLTLSCQTTTTTTPPPPPPPNLQPSNVAMPPVRSGYKVKSTTTFDVDQALGQPPNAAMLEVFRPRPSVAQDCTYKDSSGRGTYCWKRTTSVHDGMMDIWLHSESPGQGTITHNPLGTVHYVAAPLAQAGDLDQFDVHLVAKYADVPGRKMAHLLWAYGTNENGEDDFPEGKLDGGSCKGNAFHHWARPTKGQEAWPACIDFNDWHLYTMQFRRKGLGGSGDPGYIRFLLDGKQIGQSTTYVSPNPMHWVGQIETYLSGQPLPATASQGHIYWDSFRIDVPA